MLERRAWAVPPIFAEISRLGEVEPEEMDRVFNLGLGMVVVCDPAAVPEVLGALEGAGQTASVVGRVVLGSGRVRLT